MTVQMKHFLILLTLSTAHIAGAFRVRVPGMAGTSQEHDSTNLLQSKIKVETTLETDFNEGVGAGESTDYVPGTPGAPWTHDEVLMVKAKLWYVMSLTQQETGELYKSLHGPGFDQGSNFWRKTYINRMPATWLRLGFHGCLPEKDGSGGCDGCLFWDGLGTVYMDNFVQLNIPHTEGHNKEPNFNNGLGPAVEILEAIYKNASFPAQTPVLPKSLFELGKSRADLWAFAGINAAEYGAWLNNMICEYPEFERKGVYWPDSVSANSAYGQHCNMFYGTPNCTVDLNEGFEFKTGRKDCIPFTLYHKIDKLTCARNLEIKTEKDCLAAANVLQLDQSKVSFDAAGEAPICKYSELDQGAYQSLCYLSLDDKYERNHTHYVQHPITDQDEYCRDDLAVMDESECRRAASQLYLEFSDKKLSARGCFLIEYSEWPKILLWRVHWGEGPPPTKGLYGMKPIYPDYGTGWGRHVKAVCRYENEPVQPYMAGQYAAGPSHQMNGAGTVKYFKDFFNFTARNTAAIMGAHTMGRFHAIIDIFRYIWVRNGGMLLNNQYHRNLAERPDWRFVDPDCRHLGDAYGNKPAVRWTGFRRWEQDNKGPVQWILERYLCLWDCHLDSMKDHSCCQNIPPGGYCKPDNNRENVSKPWEVDDDENSGCEMWNTETGQHESTIPSEVGLYYKFEVDPDTEEPYGCPGLDDKNSLDAFPSHMAVGCPKNDLPLDDGSDLKLYELIEQYADDQSVWIADFITSINKMNQQGYAASELVEGPQHSQHVVCPTQESVVDPALMYWTCYSTDDISKHMSAPFALVSHLDMKVLQIDPITGELGLGEWKKEEKLPHQTFYFATTGGATTLVNGIMKWGVGNWTYDDTNHVLIGSGGLGLLLRDGFKLTFSNEKHVSFLSAGWSRKSWDDNVPISPFPGCIALKSLHGKYIAVGSDGLLNAMADNVSPSEEFKVIVNEDKTVSLEAAGGRLVTVDDAGEIKAEREGAATSFSPSKNLDGTISLRTPSGNYVVAESTGQLHAKKNVEKFEKFDNGDGTVSFRSAWGRWLVAAWGGAIMADRWWNTAWSHFKIDQNDDGTISLSTVEGYYWKAETSGKITALEEAVGPGHKFTEVQNDDGTISLKQASGEFLLASGDGNMHGSKAKATAWSNFAPDLCAIEGMAVVACPTECQTPVCVPGGGHNGGVQLVDGKCHEYCSTKWSGVRYCGHGDSYKLEGSIDCSGCA